MDAAAPRPATSIAPGARTDRRPGVVSRGDVVELGVQTPAVNPSRPPVALRRVPSDDGPAPDGPGGDAYWTNANKVGVGTANNAQSKVWFTLTGGRLTEVYYPGVDTPNLRELKFLVTDGQSFTAIDSEAPTSVVRMPEKNALVFSYESTDPDRGYRLTKTYITDPKRNTVLIDVDFESTSGKPLDLYVMTDPSMGNGGMRNHGYTRKGSLVCEGNGASCALTSSIGFQETSNGYFATSDGVMDLFRNKRLTRHYSSAPDGNVIQVGKLTHAARSHFTLALGFGQQPEEALSEASGSLRDGFDTARRQYVKEWADYLGTLKPVEAPAQHEHDVAAMMLKAHEDKENPGAFIASLSIPWGQGVKANEPTAGGYHLVWARDLFFVATAFLAMGDRSSANRALTYLFDKQQRADGSFPQNTWINGQAYFPSLQMDEVAMPLVLAYLLDRDDPTSYEKHIKPAADFIARVGPTTPQERWEEELHGYSPSTVAAEVAGLVCAADIAHRRGDETSATAWLAKADDWRANLENWMVTTNGQHTDPAAGIDRYYMRVTDDTNPDDDHALWLNNGGGQHDKRDMVDQGFLDLIRMGLKRADDPTITKSLQVVDRVLKVDTPKGPGWYRYSYDGYGEKGNGQDFNGAGQGRPWPLLTGERGEYELANGQDARPYLSTMEAMANSGGMLPEQVWDGHNKLYDSNTTLGDVAAHLRYHFGKVCNQAGDDGYISRADLEKALDDESMPSQVRLSAQFLLDHPNLLQLLDVAAGNLNFDDRIGLDDLDTVIGWYQGPKAPGSGSTEVQSTAGTGTGSASPLAWAMAEYIRLAQGVAAGGVVCVPAAVAMRYLPQAA